MSWKMVAGITGVTVLGGLAFFVARTAMASPPAEADKPDPSAPEGTKRSIRHGIAHEGCDHFDLSNEQAIKDYVSARPFLGVKLLGLLPGAKDDPGPLVVAFAEDMFPECTWPPQPTTTFGPGRVGWDTALAEAKKQIAASADASARSNTARVDALLRSIAKGFGGLR